MPHSSFHSRITNNWNNRSKNAGIALIVTLMFLVLMTIIGVTAITTVTLEQKMATNMKDSQVSFQTSESGLRDAEGWLRTFALNDLPIAISTTPCTTATNVCTFGDLGDGFGAQNSAWWIANGREYGTAGTDDVAISAVTQDPRYVVEQRAFVKPSITSAHYGTQSTGTLYYRITSHGWGDTPEARTVLQTSYARSFRSGR